MEALILLTLIGILWLVSSRRWRRQFIQPIAILVVAYLIATSSLMVRLATWGLTVPLPTDPGETTDAIVVLGRGEELRNRRVEITRELWLAKRAPQIFVSGMMDAQPIIERLKEIGLPSSKLGGEGCSQNTQENALYTSAILYPQGVRKIILLTDPHHMLRALLLFRSVGFRVFPHFSPLPPQWNSLQRIQFIARECLSLTKHWLNGYFKPRSVSEIEHPPAEIIQKLSSWKCRV